MTKKISASLITTLTGLSIAHAEPVKFYGALTKELRVVEQEEKFNYKTSAGVVDNENYESRLGAKGDYKFNDDLSLDYMLEIGLDSTKVDSGTTSYSGTFGRIRIRRSWVQFHTNWGKLLAGQTFTPTALVTKKLDPLDSTGAALKALGHDGIIATPGSVKIKGIASKYRGFKDGMGYQTPEWGGAKLTFWSDHNGRADLDRSATNGVGDEYWETVFDYKRELESMKFGLYAGYTVWNSSGKEKQSSLLVGFDTHFGDFGIMAAVTEEAETTTSTDKESKKSYTQAAVSYQLSEKAKVALTYGNRADDSGSTGTATDKHTLNQIAFGYIRQYTKNVRAHLTVYQFKYTEDDATLAASNDNTATVASLGAFITF